MNIFGKLIGILIGYWAFGLIGAGIGFLVGGFFDKALTNFNRQFSPELKEKVERQLFQTIFPLLGHLAKSDGRVSEEEISTTEQLMANMSLSAAQREEAIRLFKSGSDPGFVVEDVMTPFMDICGVYPDIKQMLIIYLLSLAMSDGTLAPEEMEVLSGVANKLGYSSASFEHLLRMAKAQQQFHQGSGGFQSTAPSKDQLAIAYEALGVEPSVSDAELKRAYRKLMSQHHPDKLSGQGVPEEMIKVATERSQEIQTAYELIKKHRK